MCYKLHKNKDSSLESTDIHTQRELHRKGWGKEKESLNWKEYGCSQMVVQEERIGSQHEIEEFSMNHIGK